MWSHPIRLESLQQSDGAEYNMMYGFSTITTTFFSGISIIYKINDLKILIYTF